MISSYYKNISDYNSGIECFLKNYLQDNPKITIDDLIFVSGYKPLDYIIEFNLAIVIEGNVTGYADKRWLCRKV